MDQAGATTTAAMVKSGQPSLAASATYASLLAGQKHTINDITRTLVDKGNTEQAIEVFYQCLLLGWQKGRTDLLAESTIGVSKSGPQYVQMLAEVNSRLTRDGYGQAVAHVCWAIIRAGHLETALGITGSMVRHGHLKQAAQAALCMVLPGSSPVERNARRAAGEYAHPEVSESVTKMGSYWTAFLFLSGMAGTLVLRLVVRHRHQIKVAVRRKWQQFCHCLAKLGRNIDRKKGKGRCRGGGRSHEVLQGKDTLEA